MAMPTTLEGLVVMGTAIREWRELSPRERLDIAADLIREEILQRPRTWGRPSAPAPRMTPLQIQMMLHYYVSPTPYADRDPAHAGSPAVREQRQWLINMGLLESAGAIPAGYALTLAGFRYIEALCALDPRGA